MCSSLQLQSLINSMFKENVKLSTKIIKKFYLKRIIGNGILFHYFSVSLIDFISQQEVSSKQILHLNLWKMLCRLHLTVTMTMSGQYIR